MQQGVEKSSQWSWRECGLVAAVTAGLLLPFIGKAFYIDDPLYIWGARHIASDPLDFYGFDLNWYGCPQSMSKTMLNPPLTSYYLAIVGSLFGWSEISLHLGMLVAHVLTAVGIYRLACQLTLYPVIASFAAVLTPVFLVSSTQVMCDVMTLGFLVWSMSLWIDGVRKECWGRLLAGAVLASFCGLTKYFGASVVPLLLLYSILARPKQWIAYMLVAIPIVVLVAYELNYRRMYGLSPMEESGKFSEWTWWKRKMEVLPTMMTALSFVGGGVAAPGIFALIYRPARAVIWMAVVGGGALGLVFLFDRIYDLQLAATQGLPRSVAFQMAIFLSVAIYLLLLAMKQLFQRRSAESAVLAALTLGTLAFSGYVNWIVNGRSILPIAVAGGLLVGRELEQWREAGLDQPWRWQLSLGLCALLALLVTVSDYMVARSEKVVAEAVVHAVGPNKDRLWFEGYWGYKYYMRELGVREIDACSTLLHHGDLFTMPANQGLEFRIPSPFLRQVYIAEAPLFPLVSTMSVRHSAGFYASFFGRLPYSFGWNPSRQAAVFQLLGDFQLEDRLLGPDNPE